MIPLTRASMLFSAVAAAVMSAAAPSSIFVQAFSPWNGSSILIQIQRHQNRGCLSKENGNEKERRALLAFAWTLNSKRRQSYDDEEEEGEDESDDRSRYEYARVRRRRGRQRFADDNYDEESYDNDVGGSDRREREEEYGEYYDDLYDDDDEDSDDDEDYDDDDDDDEYEDIIPNALLDQIDPDGAIDRLEELFQDPKFWRDATIFVVCCLLFLLNSVESPMNVLTVDDIDMQQFYGPQ